MMQKMSQWFCALRLFQRRSERVEITVETSETWGVQWSRKSKSDVCTTCGAETLFIPPDLGAQIVHADISLIGQLIESDRVHCSDTENHESLICLSSLTRAMERTTLQTISNENVKD